MENSFYEQEEQKNSLILEGWLQEAIEQIIQKQFQKTKKRNKLTKKTTG